MTGNTESSETVIARVSSELFTRRGRSAGALLFSAGTVLAVSMGLVFIPSDLDLVRRVSWSIGCGWLAVALLLASAASRAWPSSILAPVSTVGLRSFCLLTACELAIGYLSWNNELLPGALQLRDLLPIGSATAMAVALFVTVRPKGPRRILSILMVGSLAGPLIWLVMPVDMPLSPTAVRSASTCFVALLGLELCGGLGRRLTHVTQILRDVLAKR